ncbi:NPTN family protein [Megaselia abdita]
MEEKFLAMAKILSFLSIFIAISVRADLLAPNYDSPPNLKIYEIKYPLVLSCNITDGSNDELVWKKNDVDIGEVPELKNRVKIYKAERKISIDRSEARDAGNYSCGVRDETKDFEVIAKVSVRVPSNTGVVEGEKLTITCTVSGTTPTVEWVHDNNTIVTGDRYVLKEHDGVQNAILTLENASLEDKGEYKCVGKNKATGINKIAEASDVTNVRVKGKLAALWPFLGICAEVFILCTIILIYEKRRNKSELEESDTDQNTEQKKKRRNYD